jgi:hypothetical protein
VPDPEATPLRTAHKQLRNKHKNDSIVTSRICTHVTWTRALQVLHGRTRCKQGRVRSTRAAHNHLDQLTAHAHVYTQRPRWNAI